MFKTKLIDEFYKALFCTDFNDYASATQNAKTDELFDSTDFEDWLDRLIRVFAEEAEVSAAAVRADVATDSEFLKSLRAEYEELLELTADDDEDED